jgi:7-cyano-7-deazaguanine synthase
VSDRRAERTGAVALLSGGLDSTVSLAMAEAVCEPRWALFFDYGQRAREREEAASRTIARRYGLRFHRIELPWLGDISSSRLVGGGGGAGRDVAGQSLPDVWVENRNGIFINIAAAFSIARGCSVILVGFNREEADAFPDNAPEFIDAINGALAIGAGGPVRVESPTAPLVKREIVERGLALEIPWQHLWSCYAGGDVMCGSCESCARLRRAITGTAAESAVVFGGE